MAALVRSVSARPVESPFDLYAVRPPSERNSTSNASLKRPPRLASTRFRFSRVLSDQTVLSLPSDFPTGPTRADAAQDRGTTSSDDTTSEGEEFESLSSVDFSRNPTDSSSASATSTAVANGRRPGGDDTVDASSAHARTSTRPPLLGPAAAVEPGPGQAGSSSKSSNALSTSDVSSSDPDAEEPQSDDSGAIRGDTLTRRKSSFGTFRRSARLRELLGTDEDNRERASKTTAQNGDARKRSNLKKYAPVTRTGALFGILRQNKKSGRKAR